MAKGDISLASDVTPPSYDGDVPALELLEHITKGLNFDIEDVDLSGDGFSLPAQLLDILNQGPSKITVDDLTERIVNGKGVYDAMMYAHRVHLWEEYEAGRITGAEYTKVYMALAESAMAQAVQFLVQRDQAYWAAVGAIAQAIATNVNIANAKVQLAIAKAQVHKTRAEYAVTVLQLAQVDAQYELTKKNMEHVSAQIVLVGRQVMLADEQYEAARAATLDTRSDGAAVIGTTGRNNEKIESETAINKKQLEVYDMQIKLYAQQIVSYQRDAETKAAKLFSDIWITQKTVDEGLTAPTMFQNDAINQVFSTVKGNNEL